MAVSSKASTPIALFLLILMIIHLVQAADPTATVDGYGSGSIRGPKIDCGTACLARCRLASRQNMCHRACGTCCARCNCVPPGTSGNTDVCPCYATMTTHGGSLKCP
ncbi:Snakin-2-like protein [Drosera capensis]